MKTGKVRRRNLLLGLGQGALLLTPFVRAARARAAGQPGVGNFICYFTPNGFWRREFGSDGNDGSFKFRRSMEPATPMADHISVIRGLSNKSQDAGTPFHDGITRLLTTVSGPNINSGYGPSLDQRIAELAGATPLNLKVYWSRVINAGTFQSISWRKPSFPNRNENDPRKAYMAVFGGLTPSQGAADNAELKAAMEQKKSVLDFVRDDIDLLRGRLVGLEKSRLDVHMDALRQFEKTLQADPQAGGTPASCSSDGAKVAATYPPPDDSGPYNPSAFKAHGDVQVALMVATIGCGIRNAGTILWQGSSGGINPNGGAPNEIDHHELTHDRGPLEAWIGVDRWYSARFAAFLQDLKDVGVLDDTIVVWCSETAERHSLNNCTFTVAGGKNLGIKHRKTVEFPFVGNENGGRTAARNPANRSVSDLWTTLWQAAGGQGSFGEDVGGPIAELWSR